MNHVLYTNADGRWHIAGFGVATELSHRSIIMSLSLPSRQMEKWEANKREPGVAKVTFMPNIFQSSDCKCEVISRPIMGLAAVRGTYSWSSCVHEVFKKT